jgi:hypothetical protein
MKIQVDNVVEEIIKYNIKWTGHINSVGKGRWQDTPCSYQPIDLIVSGGRIK